MINKAAAGPVRGRAAGGAGGAGGPEGARVEPAAALPRPQRLPQAYRAAHRAGWGSSSHLNAWPESTPAQLLLTLHQLRGRLQKRGSITRRVPGRAQWLILLQHLKVSVGPCIVPLGVYAV